jgi:two-component system, chemotaxis family, CheB/CheR fusion protein
MTNDTSKSKESRKKPQIARAERVDEKFLVVGLGASAGGVQALREFFKRVPKESGMAYVVILHMSAEYESRLAEILQSTSSIPVTQVRERIKVYPDHVYVIPPNQNLVMTDGHLTLTHMIDKEERRSPVDLFFRTLAESTENRSVSVILSGTGANGSMGIKRVKEHGGVALVQDPEEAEYKDMPRNAIATGMVDYVLPVGEIPSKIISYKEHVASVQLPEVAEETPKTDEQALGDIFSQLRQQTGHDFSDYKRATMLRRIERRLGLRELQGLTDYAHFLRDHPSEVQALLKDLLISVTNFFRDPESIQALKEKVISRIFSGKEPNDPIRVWVVGCATGEEVYSITMLLAEHAGKDGISPNIQVFATDLDQDAIRIAREGYYPGPEVADVSPERLRRFFSREGHGYRVRLELRETILFAAHNVIKDPPFSHLDLVSCRNLLIYLNRTAQARVLEILHFAINPSGHLFLGTSESIDGASDLFSVLDKDHHIFRSRPVTPRPLPVPEVTFKPRTLPPPEKERTPEEKRALERLSYGDLHQRLLEEYGPPSVVVNEEYDILHLSDRAGRYMQVSGGDPSYNLLSLVRPELRLELRTALYQAVHDRKAIEVPGLKVSTPDGPRAVDILVRPVLREEDVSRGFILVLFKEVDTPPGEPVEILSVREEPMTRRLEEELLQSKAQLRATVEQYEVQQEELRASNEELQAMNEELRSAAEELETGKEELQSVNEELSTVNEELKSKIDELSQANNDFQNLMNSTDIGTIFLDRDLNVKLFTPRARQAFNLISSDAGRSLLDITNKVGYSDLVSDVELVLKKLQPQAREVLSRDGRCYMMNISPYRTYEDRIDGVVITFVDITERKLAAQNLETRVAERTSELAETNVSLRREIAERTQSERVRLQLLSQLVKAQEDERRRIARDLHDQMGQQLTGLKLKLDLLKGGLAKDKKLIAQVAEAQAIAQQIESDVDFLAWELRPAALDDIGLKDTLGDYIKGWSEHFEIAAGFHSAGLGKQRLPSEVETTLYRIAQEALNNIFKHAQTKSVDIILERRDRDAVLIIEDKGVGFDVEAQTRGLGLVGMRERAALAGGVLEVESAPNRGTTLYVRIPLTPGRREPDSNK